MKLNALAHHMSRDLATAGVNQHTIALQQPTKLANAPKFKCRLIAPDRTDIYLTGGPQTLGRGHGSCESKRISHKQVSVIANNQTGIALVKGLHTKNVSGVAMREVRGKHLAQMSQLNSKLGTCLPFCLIKAMTKQVLKACSSLLPSRLSTPLQRVGSLGEIVNTRMNEESVVQPRGCSASQGIVAETRLLKQQKA